MRKKYIILCFTIGIPIILISCIWIALPYIKKFDAHPDKQAHRWWGLRHERILKRNQGEKVDLIMIGDSITHFWEKAGLRVWEQYYQNRNAVNMGYSGDRTEHVIWRMKNGELDGINPKLAILMIGTNNTGHRFDKAEKTAGDIHEIIEVIKNKLPQTKVLLLAIFPRATKNDLLRKRNQKINDLISKLSDETRVFYRDYSEFFLDKNGVISKDVMYDYVHLSEKGYRIWAEKMEPFITRFLAK